MGQIIMGSQSLTVSLVPRDREPPLQSPMIWQGDVGEEDGGSPQLMAIEPPCFNRASSEEPPPESDEPLNSNKIPPTRGDNVLLLQMTNSRDVADEAGKVPLVDDEIGSSSPSSAKSAALSWSSLSRHIPNQDLFPESTSTDRCDNGPSSGEPRRYGPIRTASPNHNSRWNQSKMVESNSLCQQSFQGQHHPRSTRERTANRDFAQISPTYERKQFSSFHPSAHSSVPDAIAGLVSLRQDNRRQSSTIDGDSNRKNLDGRPPSRESRASSAKPKLAPIQPFSALENGLSATSPNRSLPKLQEIIGNVSITGDSPSSSHLPSRSPRSSVSTMSGYSHSSQHLIKSEESRSRSLSTYSQPDQPSSIVSQPLPDRSNFVPIKSPVSPRGPLNLLSARRRSSLQNATPILPHPYPNSASSTSTGASPGMFTPSSSSIDSSLQPSNTSSPRDRLPSLEESQTLPPLPPSGPFAPKLAAAGSIPPPQQPPTPQPQYRCDFEGCKVPPFPTPYLLK